MLFNSLTFVVFFAAVLGFQAAPLGWGTKKSALLLASWAFYGAWRWEFLGLLVATSALDWRIALRLDAETAPARRRAWLLLSLAANLGVLGVFKYGRFAQENVVALVRVCGGSWAPAPLDITLPVGVSFYTFQSLSYVIDVHRRAIPARRSFLDFALFVAFFPQLVAGPIVRAADFLPQLDAPRRPDARRVSCGLMLLVFGLFEKSVLADALLAPVADAVFAAGRRPDAIAAWCGTLAFAGQIFCDFAGYSTAAIGAAMALGFDLPDNFRLPYAALGFSDFWRRWHISLSTWLRDYLYVPLGGNRGGPLRTVINLMATMLLGGLWHGASWNFVAWGGLHGAFLVIERTLLAGRRIGERGAFVGLVGRLATFVGICVAWVFFRSRDFPDAWAVLVAMAGRAPVEGAYALDRLSITSALGASLAIVGVHLALRDETPESLAARAPWWARGVVVAACLVAFFVLAEPDRAFIYFQF